MKTSNIGRIGVALAMIKAEKKGYKFIELPGYHDRGIDAMIEYTDDADVSYVIMVQCKSSEDLESGKLVFYFDEKHYNYWTNYPVTTIITYADTKDKCYWEILDKENITKTAKQYKVEISQESIFPNKRFHELLLKGKNIKDEENLLPKLNEKIIKNYGLIEKEIRDFDGYVEEIATKLSTMSSYIQCLFYNKHASKTPIFFLTYKKDYKEQVKVARDKDYIDTSYKLNLKHTTIKIIDDLLEDFYTFIYSELKEETKIWLEEKYPKLHFEASDTRFDSKEFWEYFFDAKFGYFHK